MPISSHQHRLYNFASIAGIIASTLAIVALVNRGPSLGNLLLLGGAFGNLLIVRWLRRRS